LKVLEEIQTFLEPMFTAIIGEVEFVRTWDRSCKKWIWKPKW